MLTANPRVIVPNFKLVTAPSVEPVLAADFHEHQQTSGLGHDDKITDFLKAARLTLEQYTGRAFITQTWQAAFDLMDGTIGNDFWMLDSVACRTPLAMPKIIELQKPPLIAVTNIKTYADDAADTATTMATTDYRVSTSGLLGRVMLRTGVTWPSGLRPTDSIIITYTAGYGATAENVPTDIKEAIIEMAAHMYENREGQRAANEGGAVASNTRESFYPGGVRTKLAAYRVKKI